MNQSLCNNVSIDLSESSLKLTSNKHLLVVIVAMASVIAAFTVVTNAVIFLTLIYTRRKRTTARICGVSSNAKLLMASFALVHVIIGGFCMPTAIMQIVANGEWRYGPGLCTAGYYAEALLEIIGVYHVVSMSSDTYLAVCRPMKYRLLTSRYGYVMTAMSWAIPIAIFSLPVFMGGYRNGKEDIFECLTLHHACIAVYGKKVLLVVLPIAVAVPFCYVLAVNILVLRKIVRFHEERCKIWNRAGENEKEIQGETIDGAGKERESKVSKVKGNFNISCVNYFKDIDSRVNADKATASCITDTSIAYCIKDTATASCTQVNIFNDTEENVHNVEKT